MRLEKVEPLDGSIIGTNLVMISWTDDIFFYACLFYRNYDFSFYFRVLLLFVPQKSYDIDEIT